MTALPHTMPDAEILREFLVNEARALLEAPKINLRAFVRNVFDAMAIEGQGFESIGDAERFITTLIVEARQPLTPYEQNQLGMAVITTFRTRKALSQLVRACAHCKHEFGLDERRHLVKLAGRGLGKYEEGRICTACLERYDYRDVLTTDTLRDDLRAAGLGVEDYDRAFPRVPVNDQHEDFPVYEGGR